MFLEGSFTSNDCGLFTLAIVSKGRFTPAMFAKGCYFHNIFRWPFSIAMFSEGSFTPRPISVGPTIVSESCFTLAIFSKGRFTPVMFLRAVYSRNLF